jgi:hypothetical protein
MDSSDTKNELWKDVSDETLEALYKDLVAYDLRHLQPLPAVHQQPLAATHYHRHLTSIMRMVVDQST